MARARASQLRMKQESAKAKAKAMSSSKGRKRRFIRLDGSDGDDEFDLEGHSEITPPCKRAKRHVVRSAAVRTRSATARAVSFYVRALVHARDCVCALCAYSNIAAGQTVSF